MDTDIKKFFTEAHRRSHDRGKAEGKAEDVLMVLQRSGLAITSDHEQRIVGCSDLVVLDRWLDRACSVSSTDELFA